MRRRFSDTGKRSPNASCRVCCTCRTTAGPVSSTNCIVVMGRPSGASALSATSMGVPSSIAARTSPMLRSSSRLTTNPALVLDQNGRLPQPLRQREGRCQGAVVGLISADDLQQRHDVDRVEEVIADDAFGMLQSLGDFGDGQRRGVGGEDRRRGDEFLQLGENVLLDRGALVDRLDDEVGVGEVGVVEGPGDQGGEPGGVGGCDAVASVTRAVMVAWTAVTPASRRA